jgi:hypothetical protein
VILPRADVDGKVAAVAPRPFGLRFVGELLSDGDSRETLRHEGWRLAAIRQSKTALPVDGDAPETPAPRIVHRTELEFEREDEDPPARGKLVLLHAEEMPDAPPLCVEHPTGQPTIDDAVALLELPVCGR